jgi:ribose 5-phosphate isomerase RpiB
MIVTARQLQDLHARASGDGQIVLPYGARLTPLAADWIRSKRISLGYGPDSLLPSPGTLNSLVPGTPNFPSPGTPGEGEGGGLPSPKPSPQPSAGLPGEGVILWWCDGPCGAAKAAVAAQSRETRLAPIDLASEPTQLTAVIKHLATQIKSAHANGGVLLVKSAAEAIVYANRCPSLRAIVGTCLESVDQAMTAIGANVLILEYPHKSLPQIRNLLARFARGPRNAPEQVQHRLKELASCA